MLNSFKNPPIEYRDLVQAADQSLSISEMKRSFDGLAAAGFNTITPECSCSAAHRPHYKLFADYAARVRYALAQGKRAAQVAVLEPAARPVDALTSEYLEIYRTYLPKEHIDHAWVDNVSIKNATAVDQRLIVSGDQYEMLILPPLASIGYETAIKIQEFVEDGGRIMATLYLPTEDSEGKRHEEVRSIFGEIFGNDSGAIFAKTQKPADLIPILREHVCRAIKPNVSVRLGGSECRDIIYAHRTCEGEDIFFFANSSREAREVQLSIRCDQAPHVLDPESGESIALINCTQQGSRTIFLHRFEPCGSLLLSFTDEPSLVISTSQFEDGHKIAIHKQWDFALDDAACYSQVVIIPEFLRGQRVIIDADHFGDVVEFVVNGALAGVRPWPPFEIDITALVKPGPNAITLKITDIPTTDEYASSQSMENLLGDVTITIY